MGLVTAVGVAQYAREPVFEHEGENLDTMAFVQKASYPVLVKGNFSGSDTERGLFAEAVDKVNAVYESNCFQGEMLGSKFTNTKGLSNAQVLGEFASRNLVANVRFFSGSFKQNYVWKTVGYVNGDGNIYVNRFFVKSSDKLASNIMHEKAHDVGFKHKSSTEYTSVPYSMNRIYKKCSI